MPSSKPRLLVVRGPSRGRELVLAGVQASVGRGKDNDLVLDDLSVSRHHLTFYVDEAGVHVRDQGSGNGTTVNGELIEGERTLRDGDELELGDTILRLVFPVVQSLTRPVGPATSAGVAREVAASSLRALATPEPIGLTVPHVKTRRPRLALGRPLAFLAGGVALVGGLWLIFPHGNPQPPDAPPPPPPVVTALPPPDAPPPPPDAPPRPRRPRSVDRDAQALYAQRRFAEAVDLLRQAPDKEAAARDYAAVGAGLARGDAALAAGDGAAALSAYQEALGADSRAGGGALAVLIRGKLARAAAQAAAQFFQAGKLEQARAACDVAERSGADVAPVRAQLEEEAGRLFAEARQLPRAEAEPVFRRILRVVPASSPWHAKALGQLGE